MSGYPFNISGPNGSLKSVRRLGFNLLREDPLSAANDKAYLSMVFEENDGVISLVKQDSPVFSSDIDALLLLIYAREAFRGDRFIPTGDLAQAAKKSGIVCEKFSLVFRDAQEFISTRGIGREAKHALKAKGIERVEDLLDAWFSAHF